MEKIEIFFEDGKVVAKQGEYSASHETSTDEAIKLLKEKIENESDWKNKLIDTSEGKYCYINDASEKTKIQVASHNRMRKPIRAFKTKEQAQIVADRYDLMRDMMQFAHVHNEGWIPDWGNGNQYKFGIIFRGKFSANSRTLYNDFVSYVAVRNQEIAEKMLNEFEDRLHVVLKQY